MTYIINNSAVEIRYVTYIVLKLLINNFIWIVMSGVTFSTIIKLVMAFSNVIRINNISPIIPTYRLLFIFMNCLS